MTTSAKSFYPGVPLAALTDIPPEYLAQHLHNLAPHYWNRPETTDCTIGMTIFQPRSSVSSDHGLTCSADPSHITSHLTLQVRVLRSYRHFLCAKSTLLRGLFGGYSYLDLVKMDPSTSSSSTSRMSGCPMPPSLHPHLLPSSRPVLFLPVPDPRSIHLLIHWIYFGKADLIETCLNEGVVDWEGLTQNVEYLGLTMDIKIFLGQWYESWLLPTRDRPYMCCPQWFSDDSDVDSDSELEEDPAVEEHSPDEEASSSSDSACSSCEDEGVSLERGRTRVIRPLTGQLPLCATYA
ncbi:hypothetical protein EDC04DRAFT_2879498 [Pisolithus marmoratus]|nr:hypothetical protein EDC04DRAFT_2879498 [Pisolithus marmoratus]